MYEVEYYETESGDCPFHTFYQTQSDAMKGKILREIQLLEEFGPLLREPHSKSLENGILELRVKVATNITRIFYFFVSGKKIILTNGYNKKAQKVNSRELKKAVLFKKDFELRNRNI